MKEEVHHFLDESEEGYGQCSFLRLFDEVWTIHCSLVIGKSRVNLVKYLPIRRLELTAATLSIKMSKLIKKELHIEDYEETFWIDMKVILGYINNEVNCLKIIVANSVQAIKENSNIEQYKYISSKDNPAEDGSRGLDATKVNKVTRWLVFFPLETRIRMDNQCWVPTTKWRRSWIKKRSDCKCYWHQKT